MDFTLSWPVDDIADSSASLMIVEADGAPVVTPLGTISYSYGQASGNAALAAGDYLIQVRLLDELQLRFAKSYALQVLNGRTTILAIDAKRADLNRLDAPTFDPAEGTYDGPQSITITAEPGAVIYYTLDGSDPFGADGVIYTAAVELETTGTLNARALLDGALASETTEAAYVLYPAAPVFDPAGGIYSTDQAVSISSATTDCTIYYTTDGNIPTIGSTQYGGTILIAGHGTVKTIRAIAVSDITLFSTEVAATYTILYPAGTPAFSPPGGGFLADQTVQISSSTPDAVIYFTTNGAVPTTGSTQYTGPVSVTINPATTIRAIAVAPGFLQSEVGSASYSEYSVGDTGPGGGLVFYDKGSYSDGWRYLEAAPSDQNTGIIWGGYVWIGAADQAIGTGEANTAYIVSVQGAGIYAASLCANLILGGFDDWFLPSKDELNAMYGQKGIIGGFSPGYYWSSSEGGTNYTYYAWSQDFGSGVQFGNDKYSNRRVRAIRAF